MATGTSSQEKKHNVVLVAHEQSQAGYESARDQTVELQTLMADLGGSVGDTLLARLESITHQAKPDTVSLLVVAPSGTDPTVMGGHTFGQTGKHYPSS